MSGILGGVRSESGNIDSTNHGSHGWSAARSAPVSYGSDSVLDFNTIYYKGAGISVSSGTFTVSVGGRYLLMFHVRSNNTVTANMDFSWRINSAGSAEASGTRSYAQLDQGVGTFTYLPVMGYCVSNLNPGDGVSVFGNGNIAGAAGDDALSWCHGQLIGENTDGKSDG